MIDPSLCPPEGMDGSGISKKPFMVPNIAEIADTMLQVAGPLVHKPEFL